ncbi:MAG: hypothetical protein U5N56_06175 [Candidatus Marinimicrobia bacterium]|nr:hypothetical protein [Candidatus Neomarinimicrobiota bacterium]
MFLRDLRLKIWIRFLQRKKKILFFPQPVNLQKQITGVKRVCICMPDDHKLFYEARSCVKEIRQKNLHVTLVLNKDLELLAEHSGKTSTYPHIVKKPFPIHENQLKDIPSGFDIAIDLSLPPTALTAYITGTRGTKLTAGFKSGDYDPFYTVLVKPSGNYYTSVMTMLSLAGLVGSE